MNFGDMVAQVKLRSNRRNVIDLSRPRVNVGVRQALAQLRDGRQVDVAGGDSAHHQGPVPRLQSPRCARPVGRTRSSSTPCAKAPPSTSPTCCAAEGYFQPEPDQNAVDGTPRSKPAMGRILWD